MEETLQCDATTQCLGLPPAGAEDHRRDEANAGDARKIKVEHSGGADHEELKRAIDGQVF
jgi:hypothetical protein